MPAERRLQDVLVEGHPCGVAATVDLLVGEHELDVAGVGEDGVPRARDLRPAPQHRPTRVRHDDAIAVLPDRAHGVACRATRAPRRRRCWRRGPRRQRRRSLEVGDDAGPQLGSGLVRRVEAQPVEHARRSGPGCRAASSSGGADHRERRRASRRSMSSPIATHSPCFESRLSSVPRSPQPCSVEHAAVSGRRAVERDLLLRAACGPRPTPRRWCPSRRTPARHLEVGARASRPARSRARARAA